MSDVTRTNVTLHDIDLEIIERLKAEFGNAPTSTIMRMALRGLYEEQVGPLSELEAEIEGKR